MDSTTADAQVLSSSRAWSATPDNYSSLRYLQFLDDGSGQMTYGYGQTIFAVITFRWELPAEGMLRLTYLEAPRGIRAKGFIIDDANRVRDLQYRLIEGDVSGIESIVAQPYKFLWTLALSGQPWPTGLELPYEVPRVFYGYREAPS